MLQKKIAKAKRNLNVVTAVKYMLTIMRHGIPLKPVEQSAQADSAEQKSTWYNNQVSSSFR
jgi:hypothetical protein